MNRCARQNTTSFGGAMLLAALAFGAVWWRVEIDHRANHACDYAMNIAIASCSILQGEIDKSEQPSTEMRR